MKTIGSNPGERPFFGWVKWVLLGALGAGDSVTLTVTSTATAGTPGVRPVTLMDLRWTAMACLRWVAATLLWAHAGPTAGTDATVGGTMWVRDGWFTA